MHSLLDSYILIVCLTSPSQNSWQPLCDLSHSVIILKSNHVVPKTECATVSGLTESNHVVPKSECATLYSCFRLVAISSYNTIIINTIIIVSMHSKVIEGQIMVYQAKRLLGQPISRLCAKTTRSVCVIKSKIDWISLIFL